MLYRFANTAEQLKTMDWLLVAVFVGQVVYYAYLTVLGHVSACRFPFGSSMLLWTILIRCRRVLLPDLNSFPEKMRDRIARLRELENDDPGYTHQRSA
jgi:hypothetical protein